MQVKNGSGYDEAVKDRDTTFEVYAGFTLARSVLGLIKIYALYLFCQHASIKLHKAMTKGIIGATMSFFDNHFIGNIINRYSYDLHNIDEYIPLMFPGLGGVSRVNCIQIYSFDNL